MEQYLEQHKVRVTYVLKFLLWLYGTVFTHAQNNLHQNIEWPSAHRKISTSSLRALDGRPPCGFTLGF